MRGELLGLRGFGSEENFQSAGLTRVLLVLAAFLHVTGHLVLSLEGRCSGDQRLVIAQKNSALEFEYCGLSLASRCSGDQRLQKSNEIFRGNWELSYTC